MAEGQGEQRWDSHDRPETDSAPGASSAAGAGPGQAPDQEGAPSKPSDGGETPSTERPDAGSSTGGEGAAPSAILDQLDAQLQSLAAAAAESDQASQALKADLEQLRDAYKALGDVVDGYAKGSGALEQQSRDRAAYIEAKRSLILSAIDDRKDDVDRAWSAVNDRLAQLEQELRKRQDELLKAQAEQARRQAARDDAGKTLDDLENLQATIADQLKALEDVKTGIEAAEDTNDPAGMYVGLREYDRELGEIKASLVDPEAYRAQLDEAWRRFEQAQAAVREAGTAVTRAQNQFDLTKAQLDRLAANRLAEVLKQVTAPPGGRGGEPAPATAH